METLYSKIGPEKLRRLVDRFYDNVFNDSQIAFLFQTDKSVVRDKQYKFLTQFLGGPQIYNREYGHPRMRMRHLPHKIDEAARIEWLRCMRQAIDDTFEDKELGDQLYSCFPQIARHMQNC